MVARLEMGELDPSTCAMGELTVVGVVGNAVLLAVGRVLSKHTWGDETTAHLVRNVEKFLQELWV